MRLLFGLFLTIGGIIGTIISFLSSIVVNSSLSILDGLELSAWLGLFFIIAFISGVYSLLSTS